MDTSWDTACDTSWDKARDTSRDTSWDTYWDSSVLCGYCDFDLHRRKNCPVASPGHMFNYIICSDAKLAVDSDVSYMYQYMV